MNWSDSDYCQRRAEEERERAAAAVNPVVVATHVALAELYELKASSPDDWARLSTQKMHNIC